MADANLTFHGHTDAGGMGSSLFPGSVYHDGYCDGRLTCNRSFAESYQARRLSRAVSPHPTLPIRQSPERAPHRAPAQRGAGARPGLAAPSARASESISVGDA